MESQLVRISTRLPIAEKKALKLFAVNAGRSIESIVLEAIREYMAAEKL